ncbi:uncharacterized protein [Procambarus clarkii]|uniref:uncharacterized protein n=1 Tax=Procambarus clarkii TaxID=6728 RepID=UPI001E6756BD|nr:uncharacterized protein LOC123756463 [Procambarus clarkii]
MPLLAKMVAVSLALLVRPPRPLADQPRLKYRTTFLNVFTSFKISVSGEQSLLPSEKDLLLKHLPNNNSILPVNLCSPHFQACIIDQQSRGLHSSYTSPGLHSSYISRGLHSSYRILGRWNSRVNGSCVVVIISYMEDTECGCSDGSAHFDGTPLYDQLIKDKSLSWNISKHMNVTQESCLTTFTPSEGLRQSSDYHHTLQVPLDNKGNNFFRLNVCTSDEVRCEGGTVDLLDTHYSNINVTLDSGKTTVGLLVPENSCTCSEHTHSYKNLSSALNDLYINISICGVHITRDTPYNIASVLQSVKNLTSEKCKVTNGNKNSSRMYPQDPEVINNILEIFSEPSGEPNYFIVSHKALRPLLATVIILHCIIYACHI